MLDVSALSVSYGHARALYGIDLRVDDGEIVALIGPNGAGKTTALKAIGGLLPYEGDVRLDGRPLPTSSWEVVDAGLALVPQGRAVFPSMTVEENLFLGGFCRGATWRTVEDWFDPIFEYFPRLAERRRQPAGKLSGGEQQMLVIGRALLSRPKAVLIDELSLGLAPKLVQTLFEMIVRLNRERGTTFLLVEQASAVLEIANRAYLLQKGRVVHEGEARALLGRVDVLRSAYLGIQSGQPATAVGR
ncbi:MAG TPA: ABC transporter ATP-binding protein [Acidimicrobiia bacterium]|jgi:branched-chain amino acid transport system ATP-binding protein|nr:ABC transporter ATP-binding protein [Acidimicrobiia bacterium]